MVWQAAIAGLGANILGQVAGRQIQKRAMRSDWRFMARQGLTPQEIAGAGGASAGSSGNMLGNGQQIASLKMQQTQHRHDREVREDQQAHELEVEETRARNNLGSPEMREQRAAFNVAHAQALARKVHAESYTAEARNAQARLESYIADHMMEMAPQLARAKLTQAQAGSLTRAVVNAVREDDPTLLSEPAARLGSAAVGGIVAGLIGRGGFKRLREWIERRKKQKPNMKRQPWGAKPKSSRMPRAGGKPEFPPTYLER